MEDAAHTKTDGLHLIWPCLQAEVKLIVDKIFHPGLELIKCEHPNSLLFPRNMLS